MKRQKPDASLTEHEIQRQILDWLKLKRIFHWRNNSGAMKSSYKGKTRFMRFGAVGSPDIFAVKDGKIYGIEVKGQKGKLSDDQMRFCFGFRCSGGIYAVAKSLKEAVQVLES